MVIDGIIERLALGILGLQLVSSSFGIIVCRLFVLTGILCTCDIFASEINHIIIMVRVRWLKIIRIIVENV